MNFIKKYLFISLFVLLAACFENPAGDSQKARESRVKTASGNELHMLKVKSKTKPEEELVLSLPACLYGGLKQGQAYANAITLNFPLAAFSDHKQHIHRCAQRNEPKTPLMIEPMYPLSRKKHTLEQNHIFADYERFGIRLIDKKGDIGLYQVSPDEFGIFIPKSDVNRANFVIDFIPQDPSGSKYAHTVKVTTEYKDKFWIRYQVYTSKIIPNDANALFADRFVAVSHTLDILKNKVLWDDFISNNNLVMDFLDKHSMLGRVETE